MRLNYFKKNDTLDELNRKLKELRIKHHPDKVKESDRATKDNILRKVLDEYNFMVEYRKNNPVENEPVFNGKFRRATERDKFHQQAAQNLFHALTHAKEVDIELLTTTFKNIRFDDLKPVMKVYFEQYGMDLLIQIEKKITNEKLKATLMLALKTANSDIVQDIYSFFKNFK